MNEIELLDSPEFAVCNVADIQFVDGRAFVAGVRDGSRHYLAVCVGSGSSLHIARLDADDVDRLQAAIDNARLGNRTSDTLGLW